ncbi:cytochrome P450 2U1-like [Glandiceps talaboti]
MASLDPYSVLVFALILLIVWLTIKHYTPPCSNYPPGPWGLPILGSSIYLDPKEPHKRIVEIAKKYGPVFSIKLNGQASVNVTGMDAIREALVKRGAEFANRPPWWVGQLFNPHHRGIVDGYFTDAWQRRRRFAHTTLRGFGFGKTSMESKIVEEIMALFDELKAVENKPYNISKILNRGVSNIICSIAFGKRFEYTDSEFVRIMDHMWKWLSLTSELFFVVGLPKLLQIPFRKKMADFVFFANQVKAFCINQIKEHRASLDKENIRDFVDAYLVEASKDVNDEFTDDELEHILLDLFTAGTDTTATTLKWAILFMVLHPEIQDKVYDEINEVVGVNRLPSLTDREKLPYTEATILEIQRRGNTTPFTIPHCAMSDTTLNGYNIPKGTTLNINLWSIHYDPSVWPNPDEFNPDRFYDNKNKIVKRSDNFLPFSAGRRVCMGEQLAKIELFLFLSSMIHQFKFSLPQGVERPSTSGNLGLTMSPSDFEVVITSRND